MSYIKLATLVFTVVILSGCVINVGSDQWESPCWLLARWPGLGLVKDRPHG